MRLMCIFIFFLVKIKIDKSKKYYFCTTKKVNLKY